MIPPVPGVLQHPMPEASMPAQMVTSVSRSTNLGQDVATDAWSIHAGSIPWGSAGGFPLAGYCSGGKLNPLAMLRPWCMMLLLNVPSCTRFLQQSLLPNKFKPSKESSRSEPHRSKRSRHSLQTWPFCECSSRDWLCTTCGIWTCATEHRKTYTALHPAYSLPNRAPQCCAIRGLVPQV